MNRLLIRLDRRFRTLAEMAWTAGDSVARHDVPRGGLAVLDDLFPSPVTTFRVAEFNAYLSWFENARVYSTLPLYSGRGQTSFCRARLEYGRLYPKLKNRVLKFSPRFLPRAGSAIAVFLCNAATFLPALEKYRLPFVFTLYPGGGFLLDDPRSDERLRRVCSSSVFAGVIVTQRVTRDYLLSKRLCRPADIRFVYGAPILTPFLSSALPARLHRGVDKATFDLCFVAHKYMARGIDKGYDVFVEVAKTLASLPDVRFHVVGAFDENDIDVSSIRDKITFYGPRPTTFFPGFYSRMDLILSPNAPFLLAPGAFDGFPTSCCVEAGLSGVAVFCTDCLHQNFRLREGVEIEVISRKSSDIGLLIAGYHKDYDALSKLAASGQAAFMRIFSEESQLHPRCEIVSALRENRPPRSQPSWEACSEELTHLEVEA